MTYLSALSSMSNVFFNSLSISFFKSETLTFSEMTVSIKNLVCYAKGIKESNGRQN